MCDAVRNLSGSKTPDRVKILTLWQLILKAQV